MSSMGAAVTAFARDSFDLDDDCFPVEVPLSLHSGFNAPELVLSGKEGTSLLGGGGMA